MPQTYLILTTSFWHWFTFKHKNKSSNNASHWEKNLVSNYKNQFYTQSEPMCYADVYRNKTMCYSNGHFLIYSHCVQWRKKLHMCRKMHHTDRRKKNIVRRKKKVKKERKYSENYYNWYTLEFLTIFVMTQDFDIGALTISLLTSHYQISNKFISQ